jgi:molecular chaperone GrpE
MKKSDDKQPDMADQSANTDQTISNPAIDDATAALTVMTAERDDWKSKCLRALADYQNLLRRTMVEREEERKYAGVATLTQLFPVIDSLIHANDHLNDAGLALSLKEFDASLVRLGLEIISPVGKEFDIETMECIEANGKAMTVTAVVSRGYRMFGKLLRPAKVIVGVKEPPPNAGAS